MEENQAIHARVVGSLPVPNVQELAAKVILSGEVPERYIRPEFVVTDGVASDIPVIDMEKLLDPQFSEDEAAKLHFACQEWGFFQVITHGVPDEITEKMKVDTLEFFKLPFEERKKSAQKPNSLEGYGQTLVTSETMKLDWNDMMYLITRPLHFRNVEIWPSQPSSFRDTISNFSLAIKTLAGNILEAMAKNLGVESEILKDKFRNQPQAFKINYYPPCPKADQVIGGSPHSDATGLTILMQLNDVQSLQIKRDGKWLTVEPQPRAFTVNIGDILEIITNGQYKSIEHRVIINSENERVSIAALHGLAQDAIVGPLNELIKEEKSMFKGMTFREYMKAYFSLRHEEKSYIEAMKLLNI